MIAASGQKKYRSDIDGLRGIAVLAVVAFHASPLNLPGGFVGVDVFFVISGFLITGIIVDQASSNRFRITDFYARRVRRIFPALFVVMAATFIAGWFFLFADEFTHLGLHISAGAGFVSNFMLWSESGYFDVASETKPLLHLWSLAIEEQFYIVWPLLLMLGVRYRRLLFPLVVLAVTASFLAGLYATYTSPSAAFYAPYTRLWELGAGALLACLMRADVPFGASLRAARDATTSSNLNGALSAFGLGGILFGMISLSRETPFPGAYALLPVLSTLLVIAVGPNAWANRALLSRRTLVWVGLISYPLYLWHWPLLSFARVIAASVPSRTVRYGLIVVSILLAAATYYGVERKIRESSRKRFLVIGLCSGMALMGTLGAVTYLLSGLPERNAHQSLAKGFAENALRDRKIPTAENCSATPPVTARCAENAPAPEVLLIGDSHAGHYYSGLVDLGVPLRAMWNGGCPLGGTIEYGRRQCPDQWDRFERYLLASQLPKVVLIGGYWNGYLLSTHASGERNTEHFAIRAELESAGGVSQNELQIDEALFAGLDKTIGLLEAKGANVGLLLDVPELPFHPRVCAAETRAVYRLVSGDKKCLPFARDVVDRRNERFWKITERLQERHSNIAVFDPTPVLCDGDSCFGMRDGSLRYWSTDHLNGYGSGILAEHLKKWIQATWPNQQ